MGDIALGYGSKWHLLRYLGWHRAAFNQGCVSVIPGAEEVEWLDFPLDQKGKRSGDAEWESLDFLGEAGKGIRAMWQQVWPHGRGIQTWDAVGRVRVRSVEEWLLVEAKAHLGEIKSDCGAKDGLSLITTCSPRSGPTGMSESARLPAGRTPPCGAGDSRKSRSSRS